MLSPKPLLFQGYVAIRPGKKRGKLSGVLVSGCRDHETSADACPSGDPSQAFGALTNAITAVVKNNTSGKPMTNLELVSAVGH